MGCKRKVESHYRFRQFSPCFQYKQDDSGMKSINRDIHRENRLENATSAPDGLHGAALIASLAAQMPPTPGVYQMVDKDETILYIGKANNLRKRVVSYSRIANHGNRIARMITRVCDLRYTLTRTETDALLLEASLIKKHHPKYNVLLQDNKSFPYILLAHDHPAPQILKHRGKHSRKGDYFGPFASVRAVNQTLRMLQSAFLLRSCSDNVYASRARPCLLYQIKRCSAPCVDKISLEDYAKLVNDAEDFLHGRSRQLQESLVQQMQRQSETLDYEGAALSRDRLAALTRIQSRQWIHPRHVNEADVFAAVKDAGRVCIEVFFFRAGQNWGNREYFPRHGAEQGSAEVLEAFLAQFYDDRPPPKLILLDQAIAGQKLLQEALTQHSGHGVEVATPQRGEKRELVLQVRENAQEALGRYLVRYSNRNALLEKLAERFSLAAPPRRIEVFDNSHIQGSKAVGAMIVANIEGFNKKAYRKFSLANIKGDDFDMMREMLSRRLRRLAKTEKSDRPDLLLIDGGAGQLAVVEEVLRSLDIKNLAVVAIAKGKDRNAGREQFFLPGRAPFQLEQQDPLLYYLQSLRDEAHRFAIGFHRDKRSRAIRDSALDRIPGIGLTRKRALLLHFGSQKMIEGASTEDLERVPGISAALAQTIYSHFREKQ